MDRYRHDIFLDRDGVVKIPFAVEKLPEPDDGAIHSFLLRLQFSFEHDVFVITICQNGHRPLEDGIYVNTETILNVTHNSMYTPGQVWLRMQAESMIRTRN